MMVPLLIAVALAAAPAEPVKLAAPGFSAVQIPEDVGRFYSEHFAQRIALQPGFRVLTASQIAALIGLERQKQMVGCKEDACVLELAGALGVDGLITGSIAKFGDSYQINITLLSAKDGTPLAVHSQKAIGEEGALEELNRAAVRMAQETFKAVRGPDAIAPPATGAPAAAVRPTPPPAQPYKPGTVGQFWWVPVTAGVAVAAAGGGYWYYQASSRYSELEQLTAQPNASLQQALVLKDRGNNCLVYGTAFVAGGLVAGLAAGAAMYLLDTPRPAAPSLSFTPLPGGGAVVLGGEL